MRLDLCCAYKWIMILSDVQLRQKEAKLNGWKLWVVERWFSAVCVGCVQGGEEQLKKVWEESDGLNKKDFDPRTFFYLHGRLLSYGFPHSLQNLCLNCSTYSCAKLLCGCVLEHRVFHSDLVGPIFRSDTFAGPHEVGMWASSKWR